MFILSIATHIMVVALVAVLIGRFTLPSKDDVDAREHFFNVQWDNNKPFQLAIWSSLIYLVLVVLAGFIPVLGVVCVIVRLVCFAISWWWLIETIKCGKATLWYEYVKAQFKK